ncbi:hypothetical protein L6164_010610 [Bauhinia variegata]|uniref:Uncharacterized protein n=1 Tax=Bauhinia variegata TaxID=167791 RepID=A0ACB9PNT3_BAUVA|nr:hypothetical protein L6164_010610 [Bauhinia variegata]
MVTSCSFSSSLVFLPLNLKTRKSPLAFSYSKRLAMDGQKSTSKNRRKSSYGTSRRSILKKSFSQGQVNFAALLSDDPVVGGGISGLRIFMY